MTIEISAAPQSWLRLRETPWDARALGRPTLDVQDISLAVEHGASPENDQHLFRQLGDLCSERTLGLVTARLPADRRIAIGRLQEAGFRYVETVYRLHYRNLSRFEAPARVTRSVELRDARTADHDALILQAAESFKYGRFAEDPAIPAEINQRRQIDWMQGLLAGNARVLVADVDGEPGGFMAFRIKDRIADLILAGTKPRLGILAYPLWIAVLKTLRAEGVERAETVISAANLGVVNLYGVLGFRFDQTLIGLHLHRP